MKLLRFYRKPLLSEAMERNLIRTFHEKVSRRLLSIPTEVCYYLELTRPLTKKEQEILEWLLSETFEPQFDKKSFLGESGVLEVGPRMNFVTSWSTNAVQEIKQCGVLCVERIEHSRRFLPITAAELSDEEIQGFLALVHDKMTEQPYSEPLQTFETGIIPESVKQVLIIQEGPEALKIFSRKEGLALDEYDIGHNCKYFINLEKRNPTDVEIFHYGQANSNHSRHHGMKCISIIDGKRYEESLMEMIKKPCDINPGICLNPFKDNSSATKGSRIRMVVPTRPGNPSPLIVVEVGIGNTFDAETHNHPTYWEAYEGSATGVGGELRDRCSIGRGGYINASIAAYMTGNHRIPGYIMPWEKIVGEIPPNVQTPLEIIIEASNGASDYANRFGVPLILGSVRASDIRNPSGERRAWLKPIMYTGGLGNVRISHVEKKKPGKGMHVVILGGPGYRIGVGGGSASSMGGGDNIEALDFNSVQRGDAEMERRGYNVIETCINMGDKNPILSIHDLGAGGTCNAIPEIVLPEGAVIDLRKIPVGDETLSSLEIWGNESQERFVILVDDDGLPVVKKICEREKCPLAVVGQITGDGRLVLRDSRDGSTPVNVDMDFILGDIPRKIIHDSTHEIVTEPLKLPPESEFEEIVKLVLSHPDVCSKKFLTVKADRSVGGRVVQQQCCGPLHLPVSDYCLVADGFFDKTGYASSIGQMPIYGLVDPEAMARMSLAEAITNLMFAYGTSFDDITLCVNMMWAANKPGEMANLRKVYKALEEMQIELGIRTDGGKDSSSMFAVANDTDGNPEDVKAPGTFVIAARVPCSDISKGVTPDIKMPGESGLMYIDLSGGERRLGGTVFARVQNQLGDKVPDANPRSLKQGWKVINEMLDERLILAGHDISDDGIVTALCEMGISGNCGFTVYLDSDYSHDLYDIAFNGESGVVIEYLPENFKRIMEILTNYGFGGLTHLIGKTTKHYMTIKFEDDVIMKRSKHTVRRWWEMTSFMLDKLQANPECVEEEMRNRAIAKNPVYSLPPGFWESKPVITSEQKPRAAVIREEGTNAHEEMQAGFIMAGFEVWDVTMTDIIHGGMLLENVQQVVFPGGFSFRDVLDAGKGWAGTILFNKKVHRQFEEFYSRDKILSFGVCNGCQLMSLIGWVPWRGIPTEKQPRFIRNTSERFECGFPTAMIQKSPAVMLRGMEGSVMGIWVRHGEGRFYYPDDDIMKEIERKNLSPIRFTKDGENPTERYPFNPNGSPKGITALVSPDGRHLAMMPHPEALLKLEFWPWIPQEWCNLKESPWLRMFENARAFFE